MTNNQYDGLIWTNHVLQRINERGLTQKDISQTFYNPDKKKLGKQPGTTEYQRRMGSRWITVIAKQNEDAEWIVLSCWIDPPFPGTKDAKKKNNYYAYQRAGFWGKLWMTIKKQLGLTSF